VLILDINRQDLPGAENQFSVNSLSSSYGMNNRVHRFTKDGNKILVVEYSKPTARVVGYDAFDVWEKHVRPRHNNILNVLYGDGHVSTSRAETIDPSDLQIHDRLWKPTLDPPLVN